MPRVTHIIFRCGVCGAYQRVRVADLGAAPLKDRRCTLCRRIGLMHIEEVDVLEGGKEYRKLV